MKRFAVFILFLFIATAALSQEMPPGKWWRRPDVIQRLSLTEDQQNRLEGIFRGAASDLIDSRAEIEKTQIALRAELDQQQLDRNNIKKIALRLNEARAKKFDRELMMLVDMRAVLSDPQWNQMRNELEKLQQRPMQNQMRPKRQPQ